MNIDRRLIEDFIPIREISAEAAREKSIRKGHISTLHLWWARRPLVAARAAVFAALVAAPETYQKRTCLKKTMVELCRWEAGESTIERAKKKILEAQRERLNLPADTPLNQVPAPKVLDIFAGGGAIPLEALRLGCETYAIDLNPVAHIIELCTLVYPQKYGKKLALEVEKWGNWVIENVRAEIGDLYPAIKVGEVLPEEFEQIELLPKTKPKQLSLAKTLTPVAYLWTRTVKCPNPACGASVPLVRQTWLCKKSKKYVALKVTPNYEAKQVEFEVVESTTEKGLGFDPAIGSSRGNSACRHCGTTLDVKYVKKEGFAGRINQQLMSIVCTTPGTQGKTYLAGRQFSQYVPDETDIKNRLEKLCEESNLTTPIEPLPNYGVLGFRVQPYGLLKWADLFTSRQLLALMTFVKWVRLAHGEMMQQGYEEDLGKAIATYLGIMCDKLAMFNCSLTRWFNHREGICPVFSNQALPMVWDFIEGNPLCSGSGSWESAQQSIRFG
jgi:putative DNA methylase